MASEPCVYDISSSSEDEEDGILLVKASGLPVLHKRNKVSGNSNEDNDVVVIEKLHCPEARTMGKSSVINTISLMSGTQNFPARMAGDDDCCILDHDPEKSVLALDSKSDDTDDLVVTGESGPVACRDYPHARHLCAKFPFKSTAHESFCEQCHCYVCDTLAPCLFWSLGKESSDHCHAYEKDEKWKDMRNCLKPPSLPVPPPVSHPSSRHGRFRSHSVRCSQQPLPGAVIGSSGLSSPTGNIYPDSNLIFGVSSNFLYTSDTGSLPIYLRPYAPSTTNATRGFDAYSDSMVFSSVVPVTVASSSARMRILNHAVPTSRRRVIKQRNSNVTNQNRWAIVTSGAERQGLNHPVSLLPNVVDELGLLSTVTQQSHDRHVTVDKNTHINLNRQGDLQQRLHMMSGLHTRMSELTATVSTNPNESLGQSGPLQSIPTMFKDLPFGQRTIDQVLRDNIVMAGSCQWEHDNGVQTPENTAYSAAVPLSIIASESTCNENLHGFEFNAELHSGVETQRKGNGRQNVEISSIINTHGANQVAIENSSQEILPQISTGQEVDVSPTLDDILAQLDCSDLWADLDFAAYQI